MGLLRKLLRRSFYAAAAVSTLLLLATLIGWPVSYYYVVYEGFVCNPMYRGWGTTSDDYSVGVHCGRVFVNHSSGWDSGTLGFHFVRNRVSGDTADHWSYLTWNTPVPAPFVPGTTSLGIESSFLDRRLPNDYPREWRQRIIGLSIPCSYLALLFSILPLLALRSIRRRRRVARVGLCGKCGYDLRAHAIGEKCPECGTAKKM